MCRCGSTCCLLLASQLPVRTESVLLSFLGAMQEIVQELYTQFEYLQRKIASRELRDMTRDIYGRFLEEEGFSPVYSDRVLISGSADEGLSAAGVASEVPQFQMSSGALALESLQQAALPYLHAPGSRVRDTLCTFQAVMT